MSNIESFIKYYKDKNAWLKSFKWRPYLNSFKRVNAPDNAKRKMNVNLEGKDQIKQFVIETNSVISKRIPFEKKLSRKVKGVNIYKLIKTKGVIYKLFNRVSLKDFKLFYNKPNIVGFTSDYVGFRKSKIIRTAIETNKALFRVKKSEYIKDMYHKNLINYRQVWSGSPDSNSKHLKRFFEPNKSVYNLDKLLKVVNKAKDWFIMPHSNFDDPQEMLYITNFNPKAFPGHYTSKFLQANNKGYTVTYSIIGAFNLYKQCRKIPMMNHTLWDIFAREKDIKMDGEGEVSTRVVLTTEEYVIHFTSWIVNKLLAVSQTSNEIRYHIKGEFDGIKAYKLYSKIKQYDWVIDADWSMFDSTIDTVYLEAACILLFSGSIECKEDMRMFYFVMSSIISKNIVIPPGIVCNINRGNPSGHPCVTIINCIVNLIRWACIGEKIYGDNYVNFMDVEVYGDDAIVMFKDHKNLSKLDDIIKELHYESDPIAPNLFPSQLFGVDEYDSPDFLKRKFSPAGIKWNTEKIFSKLLYQSANRTVDEQITVILDFIVTAPCDDDFNVTMMNVVEDMIDHNNCSIDTIRRFKLLSDSGFNKEKFIFSTPRIDEGFLFEKSLLSNTESFYLPNYSSNYNFINKDLLNGLFLQHISLTYLNTLIQDKIIDSSFIDIRYETYFNYKYPKTWISENIKF